MKIVEPSEILGGKARSESQDASAKISPWRRFLARALDYAFWIAFLWILHHVFGGRAPFAQYERIVPYEFVTWIPIEAVLLYVFGNTPGKFFLKTYVKQGRRDKLDITSALRRSFLVWFRGVGMMIPVVNILCLLVAYQKLKLFNMTSWDRDEHTRLTYEPIQRWRIAVAAAFTVFVALFVYFPGKIGGGDF